jgi:hypothetical protein
MALRVVSCCTYLTEVGGTPWRRHDHDAHDFVKAVKGQPISGWALVPCRGQLVRIDDNKRDVALSLFAQMIGDHGQEYGLGGPAVVVPVPNSRCHVGCERPPRTFEQAAALASEVGLTLIVVDALRWAEPLPSASLGGGLREAEYLFDRLRVVQELPAVELPYLLLDDVMTSGGHLRACAAMLREWGASVDLAVVAGRACRTQMAEPFGLRVEVLKDFVPRERDAGASTWHYFREEGGLLPYLSRGVSAVSKMSP